MADFGLAKEQHSSEASLTGPNEFVGSMLYAAPEQIEGDKLDARSDIYALGVVLYELLTGRLPFQGQSLFDLMVARLKCPPIPLLEANPNVPAGFVPIIAKALAQQPAARYRSMPELCSELMALRHELSKAGPWAAKTLSPADQKRRSAPPSIGPP